MNANADPFAVPNLTYADCAAVSTLGPACMSTFAAIAEHRIRRLCHPKPSETGTAAHAARPFTASQSSSSS